MSKKVVLGAKPETLAKTVEFKLPNGEDGAIPCHFRYRTRTEFGALLDATFGPDVGGAFAGGKLSMERYEAMTCEANGAYLMAILAGWGLDTPLTLAACVALADECPGGVKAVMDTYRALIVEGRAGN